MNDAQKFTKFKLVLQELKTGESKEIIVQVNQSIEMVRTLAHRLFNTSEYTVLDIIEIPSIVNIAIEPICPN